MRECYVCGSTYWLERHHVFGGANRNNSEKYGMVADLCHFDHNEPPNGIHFNRENELRLKREFQQKFEDEHPELNFIEIFGRNYL
jgi:hypothetical protein